MNSAQEKGGRERAGKKVFNQPPSVLFELLKKSQKVT